MDEQSDVEAQQHHHHATDEAAKFTTIGLQTSIAIALHKLPEGFITYSTNHANPTLGMSVFFALLVHNVAEGFALALPLYLSSRSRSVAMFWASLLGGISQPLGAGIAALWFQFQGRDGNQPSLALYGCMFAATSGIMASVALHLFTEALQENHNRNLCIVFAFFGMALMGMSNALVS
jgi:ZIP family zinc transporter